MAYARGQNNAKTVKKYKCKRCGYDKDDNTFKWCVTCRIATALQHLLYRRDHIKRNLCTECSDSNHHCFHLKRRVRMCVDHREYHRAWHANRYHQLRDKGLCTQCGKNRTKNAICPSCEDRRAAYRAQRTNRHRAA